MDRAGRYSCRPTTRMPGATVHFPSTVSAIPEKSPPEGLAKQAHDRLQDRRRVEFRRTEEDRTLEAGSRPARFCTTKLLRTLCITHSPNPGLLSSQMKNSDTFGSIA